MSPTASSARRTRSGWSPVRSPPIRRSMRTWSRGPADHHATGLPGTVGATGATGAGTTRATGAQGTAGATGASTLVATFFVSAAEVDLPAETLTSFLGNTVITGTGEKPRDCGRRSHPMRTQMLLRPPVHGRRDCGGFRGPVRPSVLAGLSGAGYSMLFETATLAPVFIRFSSRPRQRSKCLRSARSSRS